MLRKFWVQGILTGMLAGIVIASIMTFLDWQLNPGGIFRSGNGTDWLVVRETALSWFVPVFGLVGALSVALLYWHRRGS